MYMPQANLVLRKPAHTTYHDKQKNLSRQEKTMVNCIGNNSITMTLVPQKYGRMKQRRQKHFVEFFILVLNSFNSCKN